MPNLERETIDSISLDKIIGLRASDASEGSIEVDSDNDVSWLNKGNALDDLVRHEEALDAFNISIGLDPNNAGSWLHKGKALDNLGRHEEASEAFALSRNMLKNSVVFDLA